MQKIEIRVNIKGRTYIDTELEDALDKVLSVFGFKRWASGIDIDLPTKDTVRDIAYEKEK